MPDGFLAGRLIVRQNMAGMQAVFPYKDFTVLVEQL